MAWSKEDHLTAACVNWFKHQYPNDVIFHVANQRNTGVVKKKNGRSYSPRGTKLKKMGVLAGVSDLCIPVPSRVYHGLWVELKPEGWVKGRKVREDYPSPEQREFLARMHNYGYAVAVIWNVDDFMELVKAYMNNDQVQCDYLVDNGHIEV